MEKHRKAEVRWNGVKKSHRFHFFFALELQGAGNPV
jgi:hypothetical protein